MMIALAVVAVVSVLALLMMVLIRFERKWRAEQRAIFDCGYPPISDEEFIARCSPGVTREVALGVRRIFAENLGIPYEQVYPDLRLDEITWM